MTTTKNNKGLNIVLWIVQGVLAIMFFMIGLMKLTASVEELAKATIPTALIRFIGFSELLGAVGLILPAALRIKPILTVWAAMGIATITVLAAILHIVQGDPTMNIITPLVMAAVAIFVGWGRSKKAIIQPK